MRRFLKLALVLSVFLFFGTRAASMPESVETYAFRHLRSDNSQLSFNGVAAIAQDAHGFVWVGTCDGINRYDGAGFKVYRKKDLGLPSAFVVSICADDKGDLWVGTDSGAARYDYKSDRFVPLSAKSDLGTTVQNKVTCIKTDRNGLVWMSVNSQGLFSYDPKTGELRNYFFRDASPVLPAGISSFCIDNNGEFWLDLYCLGIFKAGKDLSEAVPLDGFEYLKGDYIVDIVRNRMASTLLCASVERGLFEIDPVRKSLRTLVPASSGMVPYKLFVDDDTFIWLPSTEGLWRYDIHYGSVVRFTNNPSDEFSLGENRITSVFRDSSGGLWAGTGASGVDYCGFFQNHFHRYASADGTSLRGSLPRSMCTDSEGRIWIGTETQGLLFYDAQTGKLGRYTRSGNIPHCIFSLCSDGGYLWAGTYSGIVRLDVASGKTKFYPEASETFSLNDNKLYVIRKISDGRILAGTPLGLIVYDRANDRYTSTSGLDGVFVTDILEDSRGRLWIASYANGIFRYDLDTDSVCQHWANGSESGLEIPQNKINALTEDSSGRIWATSNSSGFFCLSENEAKVFSTETSSSVSSDMVFMILEDARERLWITSNKGLMAYNCGSGEIDTYTVDNGLLEDEFNISSGIRLQDGSLLLGSTNGLVRFHPKDLDAAAVTSDIVLADFRIGSRTISPLEDGSPLEGNVNEIDRIVLRSGENSFSLLLAAPRVPYPSSAGISYRLDGYDTQAHHLSWNGRPHRIGWSDVPPGHYVLRVSFGSHEHSPLSIVIRRHPFLSVVALCLYVLLFAMIMASLAWYISMRARRSSETASYRDKMEFFTNIIHEIKTPLTLIRTPLQNIMAVRGRRNDGMDEDLATINSSAEYMDRLVKEMLDFVKMEQNGYSLSYSKIDLVEKTRLLCGNFAENAKNKNLSLEFTSTQENIFVHADDSAVTKVINNLLHNALKYAESSIRVSAGISENGFAEISFRNDGVPIPHSRRKEIFKPFVQFSGDNASLSQSFGVGLTFSRAVAEKHGGSLTLEDSAETCFVLRLPKNEQIPVPQPCEPEAPAAEKLLPGIPTILVVEDNEDLQRFLRRKLGSEFNVMAVSSAEAAITEVEREDIDLVVADVALGKMSGIELCRMITTNFESSHVVVIMLSAISSPKVKLEAMESGAALYIEKPFDLEYLISSIKILLDKRRVMRSAFVDEIRPDIKSFSLPGSDEAFLRKMDDTIMSNLSDPGFSVDQLAAALSMSRYTLMRKTKGLLEMSPNEYIRTKRLSVAARLLENNSTRISEVCYNVGFNTPSYFAKCFKNRYGMLPGDYMKEHSQLKETKPE